MPSIWVVRLSLPSISLRPVKGWRRSHRMPVRLRICDVSERQPRPALTAEARGHLGQRMRQGLQPLEVTLHAAQKAFECGDCRGKAGVPSAVRHHVRLDPGADRRSGPEGIVRMKIRRLAATRICLVGSGPDLRRTGWRNGVQTRASRNCARARGADRARGSAARGKTAPGAC